MLVIVGKVTVPTAGTPVSLVSRAEYQAALVAAGLNAGFKTAQAVYFQAWTANTGKVYIGNSAMVKASGVGVMQVLVAPSASAIPSFGIAQQTTGEGVTLSDIYLDVDTGAEGVLVSLLMS